MIKIFATRKEQNQTTVNTIYGKSKISIEGFKSFNEVRSEKNNYKSY